jgi:hypothetical protein
MDCRVGEKMSAKHQIQQKLFHRLLVTLGELHKDLKNFRIFGNAYEIRVEPSRKAEINRFASAAEPFFR